jgi:hypothetical protein
VGLFGSKSLSANEVRNLVQPTLDIAKDIFQKFESFDAMSLPKNSFAIIESEQKAINELSNILTQIYLYYGVSTAQAVEMAELLDNNRISPSAMTALNQSFTLYAKELFKYEEEISSILKTIGYSYTDAIDFHKSSWERASRLNVEAMNVLKSIRTSGMPWQWIDSESWANVESN